MSARGEWDHWLALTGQADREHQWQNEEIVAATYVPGAGCDCPPPWGGVHEVNPDCVEHGGKR